MDKSVEKYLNMLLESAIANLTHLDEYISNTRKQLKEVDGNRKSIVSDIEELENLLGVSASEEESKELSSEE